MVRPCVARGFRRVGGGRSCINVSGLWLELVGLRATMEISAPAISLVDRPQRAIWVTSARRRREDRSSISSHPLADLGGKRTMSTRAPHLPPNDHWAVAARILLASKWRPWARTLQAM